MEHFHAVTRHRIGGRAKGLVRQQPVPLSQLIDIVNQRFGTDFNQADQLFFDQIVEAAMADDGLRQAAAVNPASRLGWPPRPTGGCGPVQLMPAPAVISGWERQGFASFTRAPKRDTSPAFRLSRLRRRLERSAIRSTSRTVTGNGWL